MVEKCGVNVSDGRYDNSECAFGRCGALRSAFGAAGAAGNDIFSGEFWRPEPTMVEVSAIVPATVLERGRRLQTKAGQGRNS